jgi:hypothetical protein
MSNCKHFYDSVTRRCTKCGVFYEAPPPFKASTPTGQDELASILDEIDNRAEAASAAWGKPGYKAKLDRVTDVDVPLLIKALRRTIDLIRDITDDPRFPCGQCLLDITAILKENKWH